MIHLFYSSLIADISLFIFFTLCKKVITDSCPNMDVSKLFKNRFSIMKIFYPEQHHRSDHISKIILLLPISRFYESPCFNVEEPTNNKDLINAFYSTSIKVLEDFEITDNNRFAYISSNFLCSVQNKHQLIGYLKREMESPSINQSRYMLGFRSMYVILNDNIDRFDAIYISDINKMLKPFFINYRYKELLISGLAA